MLRAVTLIAILAGIFIGYLLKGKVVNLANLEFKALPLLIISFLFRFLVYREFFLASSLAPRFGSLLQNFSNFLILIFLFLNLDQPGLKLIFAGALSNSLAIFLNGGRMPASLQALKLVQHEDVILRINQYDWYPSSLLDHQTRVRFLCDVIPFSFPLKILEAAISIGDILILTGFFILIIKGMKKESL